MPELMDANAVVRAGGVARKGAKTDPATTGDLVAKSFVHPAMEGRVVVRLVEQSLEPAVDAEMQVLGFQADGAGESVLVGRTKKRALGFPAWALVNHPNKARFALEVMKDFRKAASRADEAGAREGRVHGRREEARTKRPSVHAVVLGGGRARVPRPGRHDVRVAELRESARGGA